MIDENVHFVHTAHLVQALVKNCKPYQLQASSNVFIGSGHTISSGVVHRRDGVMVRVSASQSLDLGFISQVESYQKTLKNGIYSFLLGAQQNKNSVENNPASLLVSLGKTLNAMPPSLCGRQMVGPSSLPVVVAPV